ncbi:hypothetical protein B4099_0395 [Heyndrickxia coagulans]|uniref:Uncharacterized protein n=1 Tax=Heyndrickxia coagulans TaxID=1398 RepID=A0A150KDI7_HEYCO|nr:hypothetical protein B4099_0395 [Heyndrickxia coagulans]
MGKLNVTESPCRGERFILKSKRVVFGTIVLFLVVVVLAGYFIWFSK